MFYIAYMYTTGALMTLLKVKEKFIRTCITESRPMFLWIVKLNVVVDIHLRQFV